MSGMNGWILGVVLACSATASVAPTPPGETLVVARATIDPATCETKDANPSLGSAAAAGDPKVRDAAQKGLSFLERSASQWASGHACFGCHVHAVTVEALSVGSDNGYDVDAATLKAFLTAMTEGPGGSRSSGGMNYAHGGTLVAASHGFGGSAFARYDALVGDRVRDDLLSTGKELLAWQGEDGGVHDPEHWVNAPVGTGEIQLTAQAVAAWRQAYERTADEAWLSSIARAEQWLKGQLDAMDPATADQQQLDYALLGLLAAGGTVSEGSVGKLVAAIGSRQLADGGFSTSLGGPADGLATGQVLYTLRALGLTDADPTVARGTAWLVEHQQESGGWRSGGAEKAEAMWAVLGLVSVDVLSLAVEGVTDGQHVHGSVPLRAIATSNRGRGVKHVEVKVDDVRWSVACGGQLAATWETASLSTGRHLIEVTAVDGDGKVARRRLEVFAGDHFLTQVGTRWDDGGTRLTIRNVAPADRQGTIRLELLRDGKVVHTEDKDARPGANTFWYGGADQVGARLTARLSFLAPDRRVVQTLESVFVHASAEAQRASFGDVAGRVDLGGGQGAAANTRVELVDDAGVVLQSVATTGEGAYRFKSVDAAKYKVRVVKDGFEAAEIPVAASAGAEAAAPVTLEAKK